MKFLETLEQTLKQDSRFVGEDGRLLKTKVYDACMGMDGSLLEALINNETLKSHFFVKVNETLVFDKTKFAWVLESREFLPDSYTMFKNKIGLADSKGNLISQQSDVTLVWPYKDCVLEGGQTKEDQKRDEIFYNETLAPDEVNRLLYPKVFTNAKRYSADGVEEIAEIDDKDNLIIKGNNLLALASLVKRYEGQVKCIYIDPPYNTGTDSFGYNDKFNRSTWLTFMKNRLEIAKKLLSRDGAIYVQLDYHNVHYAKVLMDEIFGEENFQREIIWRIGWLSGYKTAQKNYIRNHDTILFYSKDRTQLNFNKEYLMNADFKKPLKDVNSFIRGLAAKGIGKSLAEEIAAEINKMPERYPIEDVWNGNEYDDLNSIAIVSFAGETASKMLESTDEVKGQKPEKLIERILKAHTVEGDLVLDFFGGSGTTAAAAHKMNRQYIVCEQLDKHLDIAKRRMAKVLQGERSGISRRYHWQGGGSFVYCELMEQNESIVSALQAASTSEEVQAILNRVTDDGLIIPSVLPDDLRSHMDEFARMPLEQQKKLVMELIDKNKLYVNLCDMEDEELAVSERDKAFTKSFYRMKKEGGM
jgi:adenine-specific DNA-methyltransferase